MNVISLCGMNSPVVDKNETTSAVPGEEPFCMGQSRALFGEVGPESIGPRRAVGSQQLLAGPRASHGPWFPCAR